MDQKLFNLKDDDDESLQHRHDSRLDVLLETIKKENKMNDRIYEEQKNTIERLQREIQSQNDMIIKQNKLCTELMKVTEDLQEQVGVRKRVSTMSHQVEANRDDIEVLIPMSFEAPSGHTTDDATSVKQYKKYIVFDVPTFIGCAMRFLYVIAAVVGTYNRRHTTRLQDVFSNTAAIFFFDLSIIFEYFTEAIYGNIDAKTYYMYGIGGSIFWVIHTLYGKSYFSSNIDVHTFTVPVDVAGSIAVATETFVIIQMIRKRIRKMIILSHVCGALGIAILILALEKTNYLLAIFFMILIFIQPILMIFGFPNTQQEVLRQCEHKMSQNRNMIVDDNMTKKTHEMSNTNNATFSETDNVNDAEFKFSNQSTHNVMNIFDTLELYEKRLRSLESKQEKQDEEKVLSFHFRSKELKKNWTTRAQLSTDVYTMMMLSHWTQKIFPHPLNFMKKNSCAIIVPRPSKSWLLGLTVFTTQTALASFTLADQVKTSYGDTFLDIPIYVTPVVRVGQFFTLILAFMSQTDLLVSFRVLLFLRYKRKTWLELIGIEDNEKTFALWLGRIALPNLLKSVQGFIVLATTYFLILQSDDIVDLLKDFTALFIISSIDDIFFFLADAGYLGFDLSLKTNVAKERTIEEDDRPVIFYLKAYFIIMMLFMFLGWLAVVFLQADGLFVRQEYPLCSYVSHNIIGDGTCDYLKGEGTNILECGWDGGDCIVINEELPDCNVSKPSLLDNGQCDGGLYNRVECAYDGGDCDFFNKEYPNCTAQSPYKIRDGKCDLEYNTESCGFDGGDCPNY